MSGVKLCCFIALFFSLAISDVRPLKVLGIFPLSVQSHWNVGHGVMRALADAGHNVTVISPYVIKDIPNYNIIELTGVLNKAKERTEKMNFFAILKYMPAPLMVPLISWTSSDAIKLTMENENVLKLMESDEEFDVVICEVFLSEALMGFGQRFNAPVIAVSTFGAHKWFNELVGTPAPSSFVPHPFLSYTDDMSYIERLLNTMFNIYEDIFISVVHHPIQRMLYNKYFPDSKHSYYQMIRNTSLVFLNSHVSLSNPKPFVPNMIEIGGINIERKVKPLPEELEKFMSSAKNGVIYFSMGSNLKSSQLPVNTIKAIVDTFAKLKQRVLWKLDDPSVIENMPENVLVKKWFPQVDILANSNVILFISHGGLLSTTESIYHGKPIIGLPVFGDQKMNIAKAEKLGWAIKLDYEAITAEKFESAINKILTNPSYTENAKRTSQIYRDQILTPQATVVYWTEFIAKYDGGAHLKSKSVHLNYIQLYNIDVIITLLILLGITVMIQLRVIQYVWKRLTKNRKKQKSH